MEGMFEITNGERMFVIEVLEAFQQGQEPDDLDEEVRQAIQLLRELDK